MKICFPIADNQGLDSQVFAHFGSAPMFLVIALPERTVAAVVNQEEHHAHGACRPLRALGHQMIDAIVVGGIGAGALAGLRQAGLTVYRAQPGSVADNLDRFERQELPVLTGQQVCGGHGHGHGCHHEEDADDLPQFGCGF